MMPECISFPVVLQTPINCLFYDANFSTMVLLIYLELFFPIVKPHVSFKKSKNRKV